MDSGGLKQPQHQQLNHLEYGVASQSTNMNAQSQIELDISRQGMQMLGQMNKDEQATFLEFQRRLQESNRISTASSFLDADENLKRGTSVVALQFDNQDAQSNCPDSERMQQLTAGFGRKNFVTDQSEVQHVTDANQTNDLNDSEIQRLANAMQRDDLELRKNISSEFKNQSSFRDGNKDFKESKNLVPIIQGVGAVTTKPPKNPGVTSNSPAFNQQQFIFGQNDSSVIQQHHIPDSANNSHRAGGATTSDSLLQKQMALNIQQNSSRMSMKHQTNSFSSQITGTPQTMFQVPPPQKVLFPVLMQSAGRQSNVNTIANELQQLDTIPTTHRSNTSNANENSNHNLMGVDGNTISVMDQTKIAGGAMSSLVYTTQQKKKQQQQLQSSSDYSISKDESSRIPPNNGLNPVESELQHQSISAAEISVNQMHQQHLSIQQQNSGDIDENKRGRQSQQLLVNMTKLKELEEQKRDLEQAVEQYRLQKQLESEEILSIDINGQQTVNVLRDPHSSKPTTNESYRADQDNAALLQAQQYHSLPQFGATNMKENQMLHYSDRYSQRNNHCITDIDSQNNNEFIIPASSQRITARGAMSLVAESGDVSTSVRVQSPNNEMRDIPNPVTKVTVNGQSEVQSRFGGIPKKMLDSGRKVKKRQSQPNNSHGEGKRGVGSTQRERDGLLKQKYDEIQKNKKQRGARANSGQLLQHKHHQQSNSLRGGSRASEHHNSSKQNLHSGIAPNQSYQQQTSSQSSLITATATGDKKQQPHMRGLGHANSYVASRQNMSSQGILANRHQELVDRSFSYQTQAYLDHSGERYEPPSAGTNTRRKSPALRKLENGKLPTKPSAGVPLRPNHVSIGSQDHQQPTIQSNQPQSLRGSADIRMIQRHRQASKSRSDNASRKSGKSAGSRSRGSHSGVKAKRRRGVSKSQENMRGGSSTTPKRGGRKMSQSSQQNHFNVNQYQSQVIQGVTPKIFTHNKITASQQQNNDNNNSKENLKISSGRLIKRNNSRLSRQKSRSNSQMKGYTKDTAASRSRSRSNQHARRDSQRDLQNNNNEMVEGCAMFGNTQNHSKTGSSHNIDISNVQQSNRNNNSSINRKSPASGRHLSNKRSTSIVLSRRTSQQRDELQIQQNNSQNIPYNIPQSVTSQVQPFNSNNTMTTSTNKTTDMQSGILLANFDMLVSFIDNHCKECPKFAKDFEQLNLEMAHKTIANLQQQQQAVENETQQHLTTNITMRSSNIPNSVQQSSVKQSSKSTISGKVRSHSIATAGSVAAKGQKQSRKDNKVSAQKPEWQD